MQDARCEEREARSETKTQGDRCGVCSSRSREGGEKEEEKEEEEWQQHAVV